MIAVSQQREKDGADGGHAGGRGNCAASAFEIGDAFFESAHGGIAHPCVNRTIRCAVKTRGAFGARWETYVGARSDGDVWPLALR